MRQHQHPHCLTSPPNTSHPSLHHWMLCFKLPNLTIRKSRLRFYPSHFRRHLSLPPRCTRRRKHIELFLSCWYDLSISFRLLTPISDLSDTHTELGRSFAAFCNSGALDDFLYYPPSDLSESSDGSVLGQQPSQLLDSFNSTLLTVSSSQSSAFGTHQTYSTFYAPLNHAALQILLQDINISFHHCQVCKSEINLAESLTTHHNFRAKLQQVFLHHLNLTTSWVPYILFRSYPHWASFSRCSMELISSRQLNEYISSCQTIKNALDISQIPAHELIHHSLHTFRQPKRTSHSTLHSWKVNLVTSSEPTSSVDYSSDTRSTCCLQQMSL